MSPDPVQLYREMSAELLPTVRETVVPLGAYDANGSEPQPIGTGTLFAVSDRKFIVTAAHVVERADELGGRVCVFVPGERGERGTRLTLVPVAGQAHRIEDPPDVAVIALSEETAAAMPGRRFLRLNEVEIRAEPSGCVWVCGFPNEYIRTLGPDARGLEPFTLGTAIRTHDGSGLTNFDPLCHFLLDADRAAVEWLDGRGPAALPGRFHGISGCAVWQTWWPSRGRPDDRRSRGLKVVGVQTSYYPGSSLLKATHWGCVAEVIRQVFPELRPVLGMHLGPGFAQ